MEIPEKKKVYKVEVLILDLNGQFRNQKDIIETLENGHEVEFLDVKSIEVREVEWSDEHPLNQFATKDEAYAELFK